MAKILQERADRAWGEGDPRVVASDKSAPTIGSHPISRDGWVYDPQRGDQHIWSERCGPLPDRDVYAIDNMADHLPFRGCGLPSRTYLIPDRSRTAYRIWGVLPIIDYYGVDGSWHHSDGFWYSISSSTRDMIGSCGCGVRSEVTEAR